jgi:predicted dehydrogenase
MPLLKVGLIGFGQIAQSVHKKILTRLPDVELVAVAEADPNRFEEAKHLVPHALVFLNYQELLDLPQIDAILICLPNSLHAEATITSLRKGKHVYLEKPLATNLEEGQRILEVWKRSGKIGMIGYNLRFNRLYQSLKQRIQERSIGELISARSIFSTPARGLPNWKQNRKSGGGVLLDLGSHHIDLVHFLLEQKVSCVSCNLRSQRSEEDSATLQLQLDDGLLVQSFFSLSAFNEDHFDIYGNAGKLSVDRYLSLAVEITPPTLHLARLRRLWRKWRSLKHSLYLFEKYRAPVFEPSYQIALSHFIKAVKTNQPVRPDFTDGYRSLAVLIAAEESYRTGRTISIPDVIYEDSTH